MHTLEDDILLQPLDHDLARTLRKLGQHQGREDLFRQRSPQVLDALRRSALVESTESSNRIEGIVASAERVREIVSREDEDDADLELADRSEQEIAGYRHVLATIHGNHAGIRLSPNVVLQLHRDLYRYHPHEGGRWKQSDNEITETLPDGTRRIRFRPTSAVETPHAMETLHRRLDELRDGARAEPLLVIASYVLDFLCIHPFTDGNGRMARLLTLLLLYQEGYEVGKWISLERIVEEQKEGYYDTLYRSSQGWHESRHDPRPWWEFFLGVMLLGAYEKLKRKTEGLTEGRGAKSEMVRRSIRHLPAEFRIRDVLAANPGVSRPTVQRVMAAMRDAGEIELLKGGRGARWLRTEG